MLHERSTFLSASPIALVSSSASYVDPGATLLHIAAHTTAAGAVPSPTSAEVTVVSVAPVHISAHAAASGAGLLYTPSQAETVGVPQMQILVQTPVVSEEDSEEWRRLRRR